MFRCGPEIETLSAYWRDGQPAKNEDGFWTASDAEREEARRYCQSALDDVSVPLPKAIAMDVGVIQDRGWVAIECNAVWGAGIYGCDPVAVLRVLRRACARRNSLPKMSPIE